MSKAKISISGRNSCDNDGMSSTSETTFQDAVSIDPSVVSGEPVFRGTRIPVSALFENLKDGATVDDLLAWFPGVKRDQVEAVMFPAKEEARDRNII
jgi:uncharacterized protein (DUF433 family)